MRTPAARTFSTVVFALAVTLLGSSLAAKAQTTVWADDCAGTGTGTQADPYCKIQTAICAIQGTGGTVNVMPGTYHEALRFPANINVISTDGPAATILDATGQPCVVNDFCTLTATTNCSAVYFPSAAGSTSRIEGLHIIGGGGIDQNCCAAKIGGGITVYGSSPTITRNEIVGNTISSSSVKLYYGGGIYINGLDSLNPPRPIITNNLIQGNSADPPAGQSQTKPSEGDGGGIYVGYNSAPIIDSNTIKSNRAGNPATLNQYAAGGGISMYSRVTVQDTKIRKNYITDNNAADFGAGIGLGEYSPTTGTVASVGTIEGNLFDINGGVDGGAIGVVTSRAKIYNNTIHNNNASLHGGGIVVFVSDNPGDQIELVNNLLTFNQATGSGLGGGIYVYAGANPTVRFNDIYGNTPTNVAGGKTDADYIGPNGGVGVDPLYVNQNGTPPNYQLQPGSPVIDIGDNSVVAAPTDYAGATRIQDGDGNGTATVDMGAYEFSPDTDGDGTPDWQDPDDDNDGVLDAADCAPLTRGVSQLPDPIGNSLRVADKTAKVTWLHSFQGNTANVYKGTFGPGGFAGFNETCASTERTSTSWTDGANPAPGTGFYYLVTARNSCGESVATTGHAPFAACAVANNNSDGDPAKDPADNCPATTNATQGDVDADSVGDACDNCPSLFNVDQADPDGDLLGSACDNCPTVAGPQTDGDTDGVGDVCDNCVSVSNPTQIDNDLDGLGDACDPDDDNDTVADGVDNCPLVSNLNQADSDLDGRGNVCDNCPSTSNANQADVDADLVGDVCDNCPAVANASQADADADTVGDICDNCAAVANTNQLDFDHDNLGDVCDPDDDNDGVADASDCAPLNAAITAIPPEVPGLVVDKLASTTVSWTTPGQGARYDVIGGSVSQLRSAGSVAAATCKQNDVAGTSWADPAANPPAGDGYYYLVRGQNVCGGGPYGFATGGAPEVPTAGCP